MLKFLGCQDFMKKTESESESDVYKNIKASNGILPPKMKILEMLLLVELNNITSLQLVYLLSKVRPIPFFLVVTQL